MAEFTLSKNVEDIEAGKPLPEYGYEMFIPEEPTIEPNKKKKAGLEEKDGAGDNIVVNLSVHHDNAEYNGRRFRIWLSLPTEADAERYTQSGQSMESWKLSRVAA